MIVGVTTARTKSGHVHPESYPGLHDWLTTKLALSRGCNTPVPSYSSLRPQSTSKVPSPAFLRLHWGGGVALTLPSSLYFPQLSWTRRGGLFPQVCLSLSPGKSPFPSSGPALKITIATIRFILWGFKFIFGDSGHARAQPFLLTRAPLLPVSFRPKRGRTLENREATSSAPFKRAPFISSDGGKAEQLTDETHAAETRTCHQGWGGLCHHPWHMPACHPWAGTAHPRKSFTSPATFWRMVSSLTPRET